MTLLVLLAAPQADAGDLGKLVMPGPVVRAHEKIETQCGKCHAPFKGQQEAALCLACHRGVRDDIRKGRGFHGRAPGVARARCRSCHTEHKGRDADIVGLDRAAFDHRLTDYPLKGAHTKVPCEACHRGGAPFRSAPSACVACHRSDDPHRGKLGEDCARCHQEGGWKQARFDHDATGFSLTGAHRAADCALCHPGQRFTKTPTSCNSCHRVDDAHLGKLGSKCETCHGTRSWKATHFDHARDAHFALRGGHAGLRCEACHVGGLGAKKLSTSCVSCHRGDDAHRGRRGPRCDSCHAETTWKAETFDHDRRTRFPLRGAHRAVRCDECHTGTLGRERLATTCFGCHAKDDAHGGQEGKACATCHNERGWTVQVVFEHDITRFPLLGLHATVACEQCHATPRFRDASVACRGCHARKDVHRGRFGVDCGSCHNPNGWKFWRFDHDHQTDFPLHGVHAKLACGACHGESTGGNARLPSTCGGCHAADDPHGGAFGRSCERCHGDRSWKAVRIIH